MSVTATSTNSTLTAFPTLSTVTVPTTSTTATLPTTLAPTPNFTTSLAEPVTTTITMPGPAAIDLNRLNQKIIQLPSLEPEGNTISKIFDYAVNDAKTDDQVAVQLGLTKEEDALARSLKFDLGGPGGEITNSQTGEVYVSRDALSKAMWGNAPKVNLGGTLNVLFTVAKTVLSGQNPPSFSQVAKNILANNQNLFLGVLQDLIGPHLNNNSVFSSLARKAIVGIERGIDRILLEASQTAKPAAAPANNISANSVPAIAAV